MALVMPAFLYDWVAPSFHILFFITIFRSTNKQPNRIDCVYQPYEILYSFNAILMHRTSEDAVDQDQNDPIETVEKAKWRDFYYSLPSKAFRLLALMTFLTCNDVPQDLFLNLPQGENHEYWYSLTTFQCPC